MCDYSANDSSKDDTPGQDAIGWTKLSDEGQSRTRFVFTGNSAIHFEEDEEGGLLQYFERFIDEELITVIVDETNRFARQWHATSWKPVTGNDIKVFLGILILQGVIQKPDLQMY